jgi:hypothetical protein
MSETGHTRTGSQPLNEPSGGGKVSAALRPIGGIADVMKLQTALARGFAETGSRLARYGFVNGVPGPRAARLRNPSQPGH